MGIEIEPATAFVAALIVGYVAELALPWIWQRWFGARPSAPTRENIRKGGGFRTRR